MSQMPAVGIFARVEIDRQRLLTSLTQGEQDIKSWGQRLSKLTITLPITLDPQLQQKLTAELAKIKIPPVIIPVQFGMPGGMPGMGGTGGMPWGAASPNWGNYFYGIQQQLAQMTPTASPNWPMLLNQGRGGGGSGQGRNLAGLRAIFMASMAIDAGINIGSAIGDTAGALYYGFNEEGARLSPDAEIKRHRERLGYGGRIERYDDPSQLYNTKSAAWTAAAQEGVKSLPFLGSAIEKVGHGAYRFLSATKNFAFGEGFESDEFKANQMRLAQEQQDRHTDLTREQSNILEGTNRQLGHEGIRADFEKSASSLTPSQKHFAEIGYQRQSLLQKYSDDPHMHVGLDTSKPLTASASATLQKELDANTAMMARARLDYTRDTGLAAGAMNTEWEQTTNQLAGNTDAAERVALKGKQDRAFTELKAKNPELAEKYRRDIIPIESAQLEDEIQRRRGREAGASGARVTSSEGRAAEAEMRAKGQDFSATMAAAKRAIEEHATTLEREAKAEKDATRSSQLLAEATAVRVNGERELAAVEAGQSRVAQRELRTSFDDATHATLLSQDRNREARDQSIEAEYQEERRQIMEAGGPNMYEKLNALNMRHDAKQKMAAHDDRAYETHLKIATSDYAARARGQYGVGDVMEFEEEVRLMRADAGGDPEKLQAVRAFSNAKRNAMRRAMRPQPASYGLDEYHDALQMSIFNGSSSREALERLNRGEAREGVDPTGGARGPGGINDAAKNLNDAAQVIKKAKVIGIIGQK